VCDLQTPLFSSSSSSFLLFFHWKLSCWFTSQKSHLFGDFFYYIFKWDNTLYPSKNDTIKSHHFFLLPSPPQKKTFIFTYFLVDLVKIKNWLLVSYIDGYFHFPSFYCSYFKNKLQKVERRWVSPTTNLTKKMSLFVVVVTFFLYNMYIAKIYIYCYTQSHKSFYLLWNVSVIILFHTLKESFCFLIGFFGVLCSFYHFTQKRVVKRDNKKNKTTWPPHNL